MFHSLFRYKAEMITASKPIPRNINTSAEVLLNLILLFESHFSVIQTH